MTPRTTSAEEIARVKRRGCAHFVYKRAVVEGLPLGGRPALAGRRHAGYVRRLLLARAVTQSQTANGRDQPEAAGISGAGPSGHVAGNAALRDASGQDVHQAPDSVLRRRWTCCSGRIGTCTQTVIDFPVAQALAA